MSKPSRTIFIAALGALAACQALLPSDGWAQAAADAERQRQALIQTLAKRLPGTGPADWAQRAEGVRALNETGIAAIPFNAENATNTADILAIGKKIWERKFRDGKSFANCFANGGKRVAATYPQFDVKTRQVVTLEIALNRCLQLHGEAEILPAQSAVMGPLSAYARSLSEGQKSLVRVPSTAAMAKFEDGRTQYQRRIGQMNFACASCHVQHAGSYYGPVELSAAIGQTAAWPRLEPGGRVRTLQMQFQICMRKSGAEPPALGAEELNNLEYYLTYLSNGIALRPMTVQRP